MSPIAFDTTIIEKNRFEVVEYNNGLTKDPTKSCTDQEQPQQQQLQPQLQEQNRNDTINVEQPQKENVIMSISEDMMQIDEPKEEISSSEPKLDQQNSSPQQLSQPQPVQEVQEIQQEVAQVKQACTTNTGDMESTIECSLEETLLNANEDYEMVSRAVNVLKFQLEQAKEDIKKLKEIKRQALSDPITYIEKLRDGTHGKIPERQYIFGVPQVDWSKYHTRPSQYKPPPRPGQESRSGSKSNDNSSKDNHESSPDPAEFVHKKAQELGFKIPPNAVLSTRTKRKTNPVFDDDTLPQSMGSNIQESMSSNKKGNQSLYYSTLAKKKRSGSASAVSMFNKSDSIVASMSYSSTPTSISSSNRRNNKRKSSELNQSEDSPKTGNYNIPWTDDEQRRLVELLAIYPDEEIQSHRFKKISEALGTRTPKQVASRVQKYFIKLAKHGLPVPGRIPSVSVIIK